MSDQGFVLPKHLLHDSDPVSALLIAAYYLDEVGGEAAEVIARAACPRIDHGVLAGRVRDMAELLTQAERFDSDPAQALYDYGVEVAEHCTVEQVSLDMRDTAREAARLAAVLTVSEDQALARRAHMAVAS